MNTLPPNNEPRIDALLDAYQKASDLEGGRPGAPVRNAVLAHARVVAQSRASATGGASHQSSTLSEAKRNTPAANDSKPLWRLAAGVVIGLVGVWIFQLTRPAVTSDATGDAVAVVTPTAAPPVAAANVEAPASAKAATAATAATAASAASSGPPETTVAAMAAPAAPNAARTTAQLRDNAETRTRATPPTSPSNSNSVALRDAAASPKRPEQSVADVALAKIPAPTVAPAPEIASGSAADTASAEVMIASADTRKSSRTQSREADSRTMPPAPAMARPAPPAAFPTTTQEAASAAAPVAPANGNGWRGWNSPWDQALFNALNAGDLVALRVAIARGANVNARDERGRSALQAARERSDLDAVRLLEAAGAR